MCGTDSITIHPRNIARAIIVFESGEEHSTFRLLQVTSKDDAVQHLASHPAVFAWLPAGAYGLLKPRFNLDAGLDSPRYVFDFEICNSAALCRNPAESSSEATSETPITYVSTSAAEPDVPEWQSIECPTGSNNIRIVWCQNGTNATCNEATGNVTCEEPLV